jgi:hypothetical protein
MHRRRVIMVPLVAALALTAGCGRFSPDAPQGPTGTLTGKLQAVGGSSGAGPRALSGQVTLHGPGGHIANVTVGSDGRFSVPVSTGTYTVSGRSPQYRDGTADCHASTPVTVTKGLTNSVDVDCQET